MEANDILKYSLFLDVRLNSAFTSGYGIYQPSTGTLNVIPESDFYINVPLFQTSEIIEYVDIDIDRNIEQIPRQEINPYYLEYMFFDGIVRNKINNGSELSSIQLNYIRSVRFDVSFLNDQQLREWFDATGKNELPWTNILGQRITIYDIEKAQLNLINIVGKAEFLNIAINR
jgi:hypothetical protein